MAMAAGQRHNGTTAQRVVWAMSPNAVCPAGKAEREREQVDRGLYWAGQGRLVVLCSLGAASGIHARATQRHLKCSHSLPLPFRLYPSRSLVLPGELSSSSGSWSIAESKTQTGTITCKQKYNTKYTHSNKKWKKIILLLLLLLSYFFVFFFFRGQPIRQIKQIKIKANRKHHCRRLSCRMFMDILTSCADPASYQQLLSPPPVSLCPHPLLRPTSW